VRLYRTTVAVTLTILFSILQVRFAEALVCIDLDSTSPPACAAARAAKFEASPVTAGFWSWPRNKPNNEAEVAQVCRAALAMVFADGRYLTLKVETLPSLDPAGRRAKARVTDRGICKFDRETQIERCDQVVAETPGEIGAGHITSRYSIEEGSLKAAIKGEVTDGARKGETKEFSMYPVRCPDEVANEVMLSIFAAP
jgi:hypothetical protein